MRRYFSKNKYTLGRRLLSCEVKSWKFGWPKSRGSKWSWWCWKWRPTYHDVRQYLEVLSFAWEVFQSKVCHLREWLSRKEKVRDCKSTRKSLSVTRELRLSFWFESRSKAGENWLIRFVASTFWNWAHFFFPDDFYFEPRGQILIFSVTREKYPKFDAVKYFNFLCRHSSAHKII